MKESIERTPFSPGKQLLTALTLCGLLTLLAACGQRGPLFLPDEAAETENPAQTEEKTEEESDEETS